MDNYTLSQTGVSCPKDLGMENTFPKSEEDCERARFYGDCFHCWEGALHKYKNKIIEENGLKHGYWKEVEIPLAWCEDDVDIVYECSLCGGNSPGESPFCPCCGGKMDLKDKE